MSHDNRNLSQDDDAIPMDHSESEGTNHDFYQEVEMILLAN